VVVAFFGGYFFYFFLPLFAFIGKGSKRGIWRVFQSWGRVGGGVLMGRKGQKGDSAARRN